MHGMPSLYIWQLGEETSHSAASALETRLLTYVVEFPEINIKTKTTNNLNCL